MLADRLGARSNRETNFLTPLMGRRTPDGHDHGLHLQPLALIQRFPSISPSEKGIYRCGRLTKNTIGSSDCRGIVNSERYSHGDIQTFQDRVHVVR